MELMLAWAPQNRVPIAESQRGDGFPLEHSIHAPRFTGQKRLGVGERFCPEILGSPDAGIRHLSEVSPGGVLAEAAQLVRPGGWSIRL